MSLVFSSRAVSPKPAAASGCGGAGPSAALPLLPDASSIAFVAAPCIRPRGARNAAHTLFQQPAGVPSRVVASHTPDTHGEEVGFDPLLRGLEWLRCACRDGSSARGYLSSEPGRQLR